MTWILVALAGAGWILAIILLVTLPERHRREAKRVSLRLRAHVEPYLMRKASEHGMKDLPSTTSPSQHPDQILHAVCTLADRLTEHERAQIELGDTMNMAVSDTMPLSMGSDAPDQASGKSRSDPS